jgi:hypothetical protein
MPMQTSQYPQCGSPVSGHDYQPVGGVTRATDSERQFGGLGIVRSFQLINTTAFEPNDED